VTLGFVGVDAGTQNPYFINKILLHYVKDWVPNAGTGNPD
jgi:hypothetical protein